MESKPNYQAIFSDGAGKLPLLGKSLLVGIFAGIAVVAYRFILEKVEILSANVYGVLGEHPIMIPLAFVALAVLGFFIGKLITKYKMIQGSGIPQLKGLIMGYFQYPWQSTLLAKFIGGAISIFAGLSLGREGPSIQIGACVAQGVGHKLAKTGTEQKVLLASGASAGLAAAFNAPLAGVMFALEEVFHYFSTTLLLSTMISAIAADFIATIVFGLTPIFHFDLQNSIPLTGYWLLILLGIILGFAGAFYNYTLLLTQRLYRKINWLKAEFRPVIPFLLAGVLGLLFPIVLGGGYRIVDHLDFSTGLTMLLLILAIKFFFTMISFGSGAPGGIFFPLLIIGATIGAVFGSVAIGYLGVDAALYYNFVILAMAGYFTAIVRAPMTGIILIVEMTGSFSHLLSLTVVSLTAYVITDLLKSAPIYTSLLKNLVYHNGEIEEEKDAYKRVAIEMIVHHGSVSAQKTVREIGFPRHCLLIAVRREGRDLLPKGDTEIHAGDYLLFLTDQKREGLMRSALKRITGERE